MLNISSRRLGMILLGYCLLPFFVHATTTTSGSSCSADAGSATQCANLMRSFDCYDDLGSQCRRLNGPTHPSCTQLEGVTLRDSLCCKSCATCGDFHWQCETQYVKYYGCNEDLRVICADLLGPTEGSCTQLQNRLVKLDCCRSCRDVESADVATLVAWECNAHRELRRTNSADYQSGVAELQATGCDMQSLLRPFDYWRVSPVVCRKAMCKAWFALYTPACSCFSDERDLAREFRDDYCGAQIWGSQYLEIDLGGSQQSCGTFSFVAGRVKYENTLLNGQETTTNVGVVPPAGGGTSYGVPISTGSVLSNDNAAGVFEAKQQLASLTSVGSYTRLFWITDVDTSTQTYRLVIGIGTRKFLEEVAIPKLAQIRWTSVDYYNLDPVMTLAPVPAGSLLQFSTTASPIVVVTTTTTTTTLLDVASGTGSASNSSSTNSSGSSTTISTGSNATASATTATGGDSSSGTLTPTTPAVLLQTPTTTTTTARPIADFGALLADIFGASSATGSDVGADLATGRGSGGTSGGTAGGTTFQAGGIPVPLPAKLTCTSPDGNPATLADPAFSSLRSLKTAGSCHGDCGGQSHSSSIQNRFVQKNSLPATAIDIVEFSDIGIENFRIISSASASPHGQDRELNELDLVSQAEREARRALQAFESAKDGVTQHDIAARSKET
ncbi:unnamed protein product, partial [Amoebophrya sp. A25]|eukprot:GSA25T00015691001.1